MKFLQSPYPLPNARLAKSSLSWTPWPFMLAAGLLGVACGSNPKYVDTQGPDTLVTQDVNIQEFTGAAQTLVSSLVEKGVLAKYSPEEPAILAVSRVVNDTTQHFDTDLLTRQVRSLLNKSGKVLTTTTISAGGQAEDPLAESMQQREEFLSGKKAPTPDYSLSGKIMETEARLGRRRQNTYIFNLVLSNRDGLAVWEDQAFFTKQSTRPGIGW